MSPGRSCAIACSKVANGASIEPGFSSLPSVAMKYGDSWRGLSLPPLESASSLLPVDSTSLGTGAGSDPVSVSPGSAGSWLVHCEESSAAYSP